jgi:Ca2+-binding RTX toxin-like protein
MPTVSLSLLTGLAELSERAYAGHNLLALQALPAGWRYVTPTELGMQQMGTTPTGELRFAFNGLEASVNSEGFFVGSLFNTNAMYIAINSALGKIAVVFRGTDNLPTDAPISFGNIGADNLNEELLDFYAVFSAVASYVTAPGGVAQGFEIISTGHSLGGALAAELLNFRLDINWGVGFGAPGMTVDPGNEFIIVRHQNDPVGNLFSSRAGTNDIIFQDSSNNLIDAHSINTYRADLARLSASSAFSDQSLNSGTSVYISNDTTGFHGPVPNGYPWILGSAVNDQIDGTLAAFGLLIEGAAGTDYITGSAYADRLAGGGDYDVLVGNDGADVLFGDGGADRLEGGRGNDLLIGGAGGDEYIVRLGDGIDQIEEREAGGFDVLQLFGGSLVTSASQLHYSATAFDLTITATDASGNTVMSVTIKDMANQASKVEQLFLFGSDSLLEVIDLENVWSANAGYNLIRPAPGTGVSFLTGTAARDVVFLDWSGLSTPITTVKYYDPTAGISDIYKQSYQDNVYDQPVGIRGTEYLTSQGNVVVTFRDVEYLIVIGGSSDDSIVAGVEFYELLPGLSATIYGKGGNDSIVGSNGNDSLYGGEGNDEIDGGSGSDYIVGGIGDDRLITGPRYSWDLPNTAIGGSGNDEYYLSNLDDTIVELSNEGVDSIYLLDRDGLVPPHSAIFYIPDNVEYFYNYSGSRLFNTIVGNNQGNNIRINAYDMTVYGGAGNDIFHTGQVSSDIIYGGRGDDLYNFTSETISTAIEFIDEGIDTIRLIGQQYNVGPYTLPSNIENLIYFESEFFEDAIFLDTKPFGGIGNGLDNLIVGGISGDTLAGQAGADRLRGLRGNDHLDGGTGDDILDGGSGKDVLTGGSGGDSFIYKAADNSLPGPANRDVISDFESGGDRIDLSEIDANTVAAGQQTFNFVGGAAFSNTPGELRYAGSILAGDIDGDGVADLEIEIGNGAPVLATDLSLRTDALTGGAGNNRLFIDARSNGASVDGGAGIDTLVVTGSITSLASLSGIEALEFTGGASLTLTGTQARNGLPLDTAVSGTGALVINMDPGVSALTKLYVFSGAVTVTINGTSGVDLMKLGNVAHIADGGDGVDQIKGGSAADTIIGGNGNDKINGAGGADILTGGAGNDVFKYAKASDSGLGVAADRITDFTIGQDKINFVNLDTNPGLAGIQPFAYVGTAAFSGGGAAQIRYLTSGSDLIVQCDVNGDALADMEIILQGLAGQSLSASDFKLTAAAAEPPPSPKGIGDGGVDVLPPLRADKAAPPADALGIELVTVDSFHAEAAMIEAFISSWKFDYHTTVGLI